MIYRYIKRVLQVFYEKFQICTNVSMRTRPNSDIVWTVIQRTMLTSSMLTIYGKIY